MKNPAFNYHRPATVEEAVSLLAEYGDEAKVLAGGQSLLPVMALRLGSPEHLIDIGAIGSLKHITVDNGLAIGAMVRHAEAERSAEITEHAPLVAAALPNIGHRAIRSRGTLAGSVAHADGAAEMPAVCLALGATMHLASTQGNREVQSDDFFEGFLTTAIQPHELLTEIRFPAWSPTAGASVVEVSRRHRDFAMCGLACTLDAPDGVIAGAALSFFGVDATPVRVSEAEANLIGKPPNAEAFAEAAAIVSNAITPSDDIHATGAYKSHIAGVLTRRGLAEAATRIGVPA